MYCCPEYKPCAVSKCTTCTSLGGTLIMIPSTRLCIRKLNAWKHLAVLFLVLLSLRVHTCMQFAILSQDQAAWGEPRPRPRTQALKRCSHPWFVEPNVKATSSQNPWQPQPTSVHNLHTMHSSKQQTCTRWTDTYPRAQCRKKGMPALAPRHYKASQVEPSLMHLALEVAKTHEGYQHATVRNLRQGPQHLCRSGRAYLFLPVPAYLDAVMLRIHIARCSHLTRQGEPVTAPAQRQSFQCALPRAAYLLKWGCIRDCHQLPGTVTLPSGNAGIMTDARACSILACLLSKSEAAALLLHHAIAQLVNSLLCQQVMQSSAGLSRTEPLIFLQGESALSRHLFR